MHIARPTHRAPNDLFGGVRDVWRFIDQPGLLPPSSAAPASDFGAARAMTCPSGAAGKKMKSKGS